VDHHLHRHHDGHLDLHHQVRLPGLREKDEVLEIGDVAIHDEEVYPQETFAERVSAMASSSARE